jgi:hypothetical protein
MRHSKRWVRSVTARWSAMRARRARSGPEFGSTWIGLRWVGPSPALMQEGELGARIEEERERIWQKRDKWNEAAWNQASEHLSEVTAMSCSPYTRPARRWATTTPRGVESKTAEMSPSDSRRRAASRTILK